MSLLEIENGSLYFFQAWDYVKGEYSREFYIDRDPEYEKIITALEGYFVKPHENVDINEGGVQKIGEFIKQRLNESELDTKKTPVIVFATEQDCEKVFLEEKGFTPECNSDTEKGSTITNIIQDGTVWNQAIYQTMIEKK